MRAYGCSLGGSFGCKDTLPLYTYGKVQPFLYAEENGGTDEGTGPYNRAFIHWVKDGCDLSFITKKA